MALDLQGFVTPEQNFSAIYKAAENMERKRYRDQQLQEQRNAKRASTAKFLMDYADPKQHLSGSPFDPEISKNFMDILQEGARLADEGADTNMLMMALGPKVSKLSEYAEKAKIINQRLKEQLKNVKGKGYNLGALEQESRKTAFYNPDGSLKDISTIDPSVDYLTETVRLHPDKVTTDAGIDEFVRTAPKYTEVKDYTTYAPSGMMNRRKAEITTAPWMVQDVDENGRPIEGFVPKFRIALEKGKPKTHKFTDANGNPVEAPIRLLDDQEFKSIMAGNPDVADYIRGLVKQHLHLADSEDVNMDSPQAMQLAQGYLYDELKRRKGGSAKDIQIQDKPSAPQTRNYFTGRPYAVRGGGSGSGSGSGAKSEPELADVYGEIKQLTSSRKKGMGAPLNKLSSTAQKVVLKYARDLRGDNEIGNGDIYVKMDDDDMIRIYDATTNESIGELDYKDANLPANATLGIKAKQEVVRKGNQQATQTTTKPTKFKGVPQGGF